MPKNETIRKTKYETCELLECENVEEEIFFPSVNPSDIIDDMPQNVKDPPNIEPPPKDSKTGEQKTKSSKAGSHEHYFLELISWEGQIKRKAIFMNKGYSAEILHIHLLSP